MARRAGDREGGSGRRGGETSRRARTARGEAASAAATPSASPKAPRRTARRAARDGEKAAGELRATTRPRPAFGLRGEDRIVEWLRSRAGPLLGDDAAVLPNEGPWAVTVDTQIAGVHVPAALPPASVARRLLRVNLSDLAATGATPRWAFLALATPPGFAHRAFFTALLDECEIFGVRLAGGDLARAPVLTAALTLIGRQAGEEWLRRGNARPGDRLWVGGTLGESAAGCRLLARGATAGPRSVAPPAGLPRNVVRAARAALHRHLLPEPQLALGRWLAGQRRAAAIDVSDGLARDLHRLCRESEVRAEVDAPALPQADGFAALAEAIDAAPLDLVLGGGEDYVLLFALPEGVVPPPRLGCTPIGKICKGSGVGLRRDGKVVPLADRGWDHLES